VTQRDENGERIVDRNTFLPPDETTERLSKIERGFTLPQQNILERLETQEATNADLADQIFTVSNTTVNTSVSGGSGVGFIPYGDWLLPGGWTSRTGNSTAGFAGKLSVVPFLLTAGTYDELAFQLSTIPLNPAYSGGVAVERCLAIAIYDAAGGKHGEFQYVYDSTPGITVPTDTVLAAAGSAVIPADGTYWVAFASSATDGSGIFVKASGGGEWVFPTGTRMAFIDLPYASGAVQLQKYGVYSAYVVPIGMPLALTNLDTYGADSNAVPLLWLRVA
jgi:hypothetical protein